MDRCRFRLTIVILHAMYIHGVVIKIYVETFFPFLFERLKTNYSWSIHNAVIQANDSLLGNRLHGQWKSGGRGGSTKNCPVPHGSWVRPCQSPWEGILHRPMPPGLWIVLTLPVSRHFLLGVTTELPLAEGPVIPTVYIYTSKTLYSTT